jgi:hypothetical protein
MAMAEEILELIGAATTSAKVTALIASDCLTESTDPDYEEGEARRTYLTCREKGYSFIVLDGRIVTAHVYAKPSEGFDQFPSPLPGALPSTATREEVIARFGPPERSGAPMTISGLRRKGPWDRFHLGPIYIHFQYSESGGSIEMVTLMHESFVP